MGSMARQFSRLIAWWRRRSPRHYRVYIGSRGKTHEVISGSKCRRCVRFPVHISVCYGETDSCIYKSFILNASRGGLYIVSKHLLPMGSNLDIHFFIPPEEKLLGAFEGEVVGINPSSDRYPQGMHVRLTGYAADMKRFIDYTEERAALLDQMA